MPQVRLWLTCMVMRIENNATDPKLTPQDFRLNAAHYLDEEKLK
jgi:hypothetical protein